MEGKRTAASGSGPVLDSGRAWVVMGAAFVANLCSVGMVTSRSVYLTVWMDYFQAGAASVSMAMGLSALTLALTSKS